MRLRWEEEEKKKWKWKKFGAMTAAALSIQQNSRKQNSSKNMYQRQSMKELENVILYLLYWIVIVRELAVYIALNAGFKWTIYRQLPGTEEKKKKHPRTS